ncbi:hypothetical protein UlMin_008530 [Ulmus minor]
MSPTILTLLLLIFGSICFYFLTRRCNPNKTGRKLPPGPRPLPIIGNLHNLTTLPHRGLQSLSQKYGPIMYLRLGQVPTIVISSPRAAELFLKTNDVVFASRPKVQASDLLSYGSKGMAFSEYGPYWRNVRKLCTVKLLSSSKIESFAALRKEEVVAAVEAVKGVAAAHGVVDLSEKVGKLVEDISYRIIFGRNKDHRFDLGELVEEALILGGAINVADYAPYLAPFDLQGFTRRLKVVSKKLDKALEKIIMEHEQATNGDHQDFVDVLLSLMNQPMNPQDEQVFIIDRTNIKAILLDLMVASFDTSATTIVWNFSELLRNPRVMKNLQQELESVVGLDRMVEERDLRQLSYLDMVVKESFRLHPVAPLLVPRESTEDITIEGFFIPKKSRIIVNTWTIGRDPNVWSENVEEFYPERFIGGDIDELKGKDFRLLPFGSGRRGCPGIQMGLVAVRFALAQLVHCFNWELPSDMQPKDLDMTESFGLSVGRANNLFAKPTYRLAT